MKDNLILLGCTVLVQQVITPKPKTAIKTATGKESDNFDIETTILKFSDKAKELHDESDKLIGLVPVLSEYSQPYSKALIEKNADGTGVFLLIFNAEDLVAVSNE